MNKAKKAWKEIYRSFRVLRREMTKVRIDLLLYGTGIVKITPGKDPERIDPKDIMDLIK